MNDFDTLALHGVAFRTTLDEIELYPDGTIRPGIGMTVTPEKDEKARNGYFCFAECGEDWSHSDIGAWPDACPCCGNTQNTSENYARIFSGPVKNESRIDWIEEEDRLERQGWERDMAEGLRSKGIWVPGSDN